MIFYFHFYGDYSPPILLKDPPVAHRPRQKKRHSGTATSGRGKITATSGFT